MPINLEGPIATLNGLMPDEVLITRLKDAERVWDDVTMQYTTPSGKPTTLYQGAAMVGNQGPGQDVVEGRQEAYQTTYTLRIPLGSGPRELFQKGDLVRVTKAGTNKGLVGHEFHITQEIETSFAVSRRLLMTDLEGTWQ
jgi:hypothetical protein